MATLKQRVHRYNGTDYDTVHYETQADLVTYTNNSQSTVSGALDDLYSNKAPAYQYSTTDLTAGTSSLTTGKLYFVYE